MFHHRGWIYCSVFLIPLASLVLPGPARDGLRARTRGNTHPLARKAAVARPGALASVLVPVDSSFLGSDGVQYRLSGTLTLAPLAPLPPPPPPPPTDVAISYVTDSPLRPVLGGISTVTVVMTKASTVPITMPVTITDTALSGPTSVTLPAGASQVSFPVTWKTAVSVERYAAITVTLGVTSRYANVILSASSTPVPVPVPGAGNPVINDFLNADGSPARVLVYGQEVRIIGQGFGPQSGKVIWIGAAVQVVSWTDTEVRVRLPQPKPPGGGLQFLLIKPDGGYSETALPSDLPAPGGRR